MATKRSAKGTNADLVLRALRDAAAPLSAYDLLERLGPQGIVSPVTVYRALDRLIAEGSAHRLETLSAYIASPAAGTEGADPAGFAICDCCGSVEALVDPSLEARLAADAAARRFTPRRMTVEVHGVCADCGDGGREPGP